MNPQEQYEAYEKEKPKFPLLKYLIGFIVAIFLTLIGIPIAGLYFPVGLIIVIWIHNSKVNKYNQLKAGYLGEAIAYNYLVDHLPPKFKIYYNLELPGKNAEMDFVVLGENSLTVVESKHHSGEIYGNENDHHLTRKKTSSSGKVYTDKFYNPIKQVKTHVYKLSEKIKEDLGQSPWINHKVLFTNLEASIFTEDNNVVRTIDSLKLIDDIFKLDEKGSINRNKIEQYLDRII